MSDTTLRAWLLTETPQSRRQAAWGRSYRGWLLFRRNHLAMIGLVTVIVLVVGSLAAPLIPPYDPRRRN